jgi:predicted regulator of Ras-like GTPase activity (Roadblock/LC7/MglB family)
MEFRNLLKEVMQTEYINAAFIIDRDGYLITHQSRHGLDSDVTLTVQICAVQGAIDGLGSQLNLGDGRQFMLEFTGGIVMLASFAPELLLVIIAAPSATLGLFRTFFSNFLSRFTKEINMSNEVER